MKSQKPKSRDQLKNFVASQVVRHREKAGLSSPELATKTGMTRAGIHLIESAKQLPSVFILLKISAALDVPVSKLIGQV